MRPFKFIIASLVFSFAVSVFAPLAVSANKGTNREAKASSILELAKLDAMAKKRISAKARIALVAESSELFKGIENLEPPESNRVPNYLRAIAALPNATKPLAHLVKTVIYGGTVAPESKMSMGLRIAQINGSPYVAAHLQRLLGVSPRGQKALNCLKSNDLDTISAADRLALTYAELLTQDANGITDEVFQKTRAQFNDSQLVELTMTVCFFNYFTRFLTPLRRNRWRRNTSRLPQESRWSPTSRCRRLRIQWRRRKTINRRPRVSGWGLPIRKEP
jgi:alkylhydroperoxidase family enzyme